jgi:hypothetical protein
MNPEHGQRGSIDPQSIRDAFQSVRLTEEQFERHAARIDAELSRGGFPVLPVAIAGAVGVVVLILAVAFWPFGGDTDDQGDGTDTPPIVAIGETPSPQSVADDEAATEPSDLSCEPSDAAQAMAGFVDRYNAGDLDALRAMLPEDSDPRAPSSDPGEANPALLLGFFYDADTVFGTRDEVVEFLAERHEAGERWQLTVDALGSDAVDTPPSAAEIEVVRASIERHIGDDPSGESRGIAVIDCAREQVVLWAFDSFIVDAAGPIPVEQFLDAAGAYNIGEGRVVHMRIAIDLREDGGALREWDVLRIEGGDGSGNLRQVVYVDTLDGQRAVTYIFDGARWFIDQRGWQASGNAVAPSLPAEITLVRAEPARTAELIVARQDEIPQAGPYTLSQELPLDPEEFFALGEAIDSPIVERWFDVLIEDGNVIISRYRMVDESGNEILTPEVRFVDVRRSGDGDAEALVDAPGLDGEEFQFRMPDPLPEGIEILGQERGPDGLAETLQVQWRGVPLTIRVTPSRGGLDPRVPVEQWGPSAPERVVGYNGNWLVWQAAEGTDVPVGAVWDDGRHRFDLTASLENVPSDATWHEGALVELVATLFAAAGSTSE